MSTGDGIGEAVAKVARRVRADVSANVRIMVFGVEVKQSTVSEC